MIKGGSKRIVGFYAAGRPGIAEAWRPREEDPETCGPAEADRRYKTLVRLMLAGEIVDELRLVSVFEQDDATGEILRCATSDDFESTSAASGEFGFALIAAFARGSGRHAAAVGLRRGEVRRVLS